MYTRTVEVIKEISRHNVLIKIPLLSVKDLTVDSLTVESWTMSPSELHVLLSRKEAQCPLFAALEKKHIWNTYTYPGEMGKLK
jgi:hypothetical protein